MKADLHIHSCLSPCGGLEMSPRTIARRARELGLGLVALTDHNCTLNCPAFVEACRREGVAALCGLEVCTQEEAHALCLFDQLDAALECGTMVQASLPVTPAAGFEELERAQWILNADDEVEGRVEHYLGLASTLTLTELRQRVEQMGGLMIPAHVDRPAFSVLSQLGFMPPDIGPAIEVSFRYDLRKDPLRLNHRYTLLTHSDAHQPEQMGRAHIELDPSITTIPALRTALAQRAVRAIHPVLTGSSNGP